MSARSPDGPPRDADRTGRSDALTPSTRYFAGYVWNTIANIGDFGLAYAFSVLLARMLEPAGYGAYASVLSVCTLAFVFTSIGVDRTLHKFLGEASATDEASKSVPSLLRLLFVVRVALTAALVVAVLLGRQWIALRFGNEAIAPLIGVSALFIIGQSLTSFASNVLIGFVRTRTVAVFTLVLRTANLALAYWLLRTGASVQDIILLLGVTSSTLFFAYLWKILPLLRGRSTALDVSPVVAFAASAWALAAVNFGLGKQSDVILLNVIRHSQTEVALYDVAYSLTQVAGMALTIGLSGIALTLFSKRYKARPDAMGSLWQSFIVLMGASVVPLVVFLIVHAPACVRAVYGTEYEQAGVLLRAFAIPMTVGWLLGGGASSTVLHAVYRIRTVLWIRLATGAANVALNVFLIRAWGPGGALLGTGLMGAIAVTAELTAVRRALAARVPTSHLPGVVVATALALVPSLLARPQGIAALAAHGVIGIGIYVVVLRVMRPLPSLDTGLVAALPAPARRWLALLRAVSDDADSDS